MLTTLAVSPPRAAHPVAPAVTIATILAAYERATHAPPVTTIETQGTESGEGLTGEFHSWRRGVDELDIETLGPRTEETLRLGDRVWVRNADGNVRELRGSLRRRALTAEFVDSDAFVRAPSHVQYLGTGAIDGKRMWRIAVNADGGQPETLWIDATSGLLVRTEFIDGDGPTFVDLADWRVVDGQKIPFRSRTTDGDHAFDLIEQTTTVKIGAPVDDARFAPLAPRTVVATAVQTVPLIEVDSHVACTVSIDGNAYVFLIDSGAQNILIDSQVAHVLGLDELGALEVRGAVRSGGLHVARLPHLRIGDASLDDLVVSTIDLRGTSGALHVDGILGYPFFASSLVQLDFVNGVMRFGPPGSFDPPGERIDLDVDREIPEATAQLNDSLDAPFLVDTGNSGDLLLYHPFAIAHPAVVPASGARAMSYGVGGVDAMYQTHLQSLRLGNVSLFHPAVDVVLAGTGAFADRIDAGNIGLGVLRKFVVTFDLANAAMYLLPATSP